MRHRRPPVPHWKKGKGFCRWCGEAVMNLKGESSKGRWHPACVSAYKLAAWSAEQRRVCWERDKGVCGVCGVDSVDLRSRAAATYREQGYSDEWIMARLAKSGKLWQADHIRPLVDGGGLDLAYFEASNLMTLCSACHRQKTSREASQRALARKARAVSIVVRW